MSQPPRTITTTITNDNDNTNTNTTKTTTTTIPDKNKNRNNSKHQQQQQQQQQPGDIYTAIPCTGELRCMTRHHAYLPMLPNDVSHVTNDYGCVPYSIIMT
jgi:hypothetical protein